MSHVARSGIARSGHTRSGDLGSDSASFEIAGSSRLSALSLDSLTITYGLGKTPSTLSCEVKGLGWEPQRGQEIKVYNGGIDVGIPLFAGHILEVEYQQRRMGDTPTYALSCVDYTWLLDRFARVTQTYRTMGINTCLRRIIDSFTDGGFTVGSAPSSLGDIDEMTFTQESVSNAVDRLAQASGVEAYWLLDFDKRVSIFTGPVGNGNAFAVNDNESGWEDFRVITDLSQVRTQVIYEGSASQATAQVSAGASVVPVDETGRFTSAGGTARSGTTIFTYTGLSVTSGPGNLTGCASIENDIGQGDEVRVVADETDSTAVTNLAAILGGGLSGVAVHYVQDGRLSLSEARSRAEAQLAIDGGARQDLSFMAVSDPYLRPGKTVDVSLTGPTSISGTFRVHGVTATVRTLLDSSTVGLQRRVTLTKVKRQLAAILSDHDNHLQGAF